MARVSSNTNARKTRRYKAFVSYTHADKALGARLFSRIDGYRTPKALRGRETPMGPVSDRLYPCFRDREELKAARDVRAEMDAALEASDSLVVVCSPAAAQSEWVAHEIETFARLGRADRIHAVLAEGEAEAAFPPALTRVVGTPLAADLRREGDGFADGALKLIAGVLGVPFGELKDREVARQRAAARRNAGIAAAFFELLVGALWVVLDRNEQFQKAFVVIVEELAGNLNDTIARQESRRLTTEDAAQEPGNAQRVVDRAFAIAPKNPNLQREQARMLMSLSRQYRTVGDLAKAKAAADEAAAIYARLGKRGGEDLNRLREQSVALNELGDTLVAQGDQPGALAAYTQSQAIAERLAASYPGNAEWQRDLSVSLNKIGDVRRAQWDPASALKANQESLLIARDLAWKDKGNIQYKAAVGSSVGKLGIVAAQTGDAAAACKWFRELVSNSKEIAAIDPTYANYRQRVEASRQVRDQLCAAQ